MGRFLWGSPNGTEIPTRLVPASARELDAGLFGLYLRYRARVDGIDIHSLTLEQAMGMYDRDPNFEDEFAEGDRMVITAMQYVGEVRTVHGTAQKTLITVVTRDSYVNPTKKQITFSALGAGFAAMAQRATGADFPHVAEYVRVPVAAGRVKRFVRVDVEPGAWVHGDDGPPLTDEQKGIGAESPAPNSGAPAELSF